MFPELFIDSLVSFIATQAINPTYKRGRGGRERFYVEEKRVGRRGGRGHVLLSAREAGARRRAAVSERYVSESLVDRAGGTAGVTGLGMMKLKLKRDRNTGSHTVAEEQGSPVQWDFQSDPQPQGCVIYILDIGLLRCLQFQLYQFCYF